MKDNPRFSIIIPLYNKEQSIQNAIYSILKQDMDDFEIIVVNDGSTDCSMQKVKEIEDRRLRIVDKINGGVSSARNEGILRAKGEWICFLDADDIWLPDFLSVTDTLINEFPEAKLVCPSYKVQYKKKEIIPKWKSVDLEKDAIVNNFFEMATASWWICNSSCVALERKTLLKQKYYFPENETVYEDFDLWLRIGTMYPVAHSNKVCAIYQRGTEENARKTHSQKIVYSETYMNTIEGLKEKFVNTSKEYKWLCEIKDRRMVPYIFSMICTGKISDAREILCNWKPINRYIIYKAGLRLIAYMPKVIVHTIQELRYKIF